jgi:hypothetical protein
MGSDDAGNHLRPALHLAAVLLDWKELEAITIAMPEDLTAGQKETSDHDYWSWTLHRRLLAAFAQGRWQEIRLVHPTTYTDPNIFLYHNIKYVEEWILPLEPQRLLGIRRSHYWNALDAGSHRQPVSRERVNQDCEHIWAERGIVIQAENPGPGEMGTVLAVRWRAPWIREYRQAATTFPIPKPPSLIPWQLLSSIEVPPFLQLLPQWRVALCREHGDCFTQDDLGHHLIHHHGATEDESTDVCFSSPIQELAKTWKDVVHPQHRITAIPCLQVIDGYQCTDIFCQFRTATMASWISHCRKTGHSSFEMKESRMFCQTLSSCPANVRYFAVYPLDDFSFPLADDQKNIKDLRRLQGSEDACG